jgi:hypothetical protein
VDLRRLLEKAAGKLDEINDRSHRAQLAKLTPAERERYDFWERRPEAARNGTPEDRARSTAVIAA